MCISLDCEFSMDIKNIHKRKIHKKKILNKMNVVTKYKINKSCTHFSYSVSNCNVFS